VPALAITDLDPAEAWRLQRDLCLLADRRELEGQSWHAHEEHAAIPPAAHLVDVPVANDLDLGMAGQDRQEFLLVLEAQGVQPADVDGKRLVMEEYPGRPAGMGRQFPVEPVELVDGKTPLHLAREHGIQQQESHPALLEGLAEGSSDGTLPGKTPGERLPGHRGSPS
jgi:hypothetical protein